MPGPPPPNAAIAELARGLGMDDARELVRMFLEGFEPLVRALAASGREERRRAAHSLKSSAHIVGLTGLSEQMAELENRLANADHDVSASDITAAREKFMAAAPTFRAFAAPAET